MKTFQKVASDTAEAFSKKLLKKIVQDKNEENKLEIDFEKAIALIQEWKTQIIGFAISSQTMLVGYKDTVQKMKDRGNEDFMGVVNEELGKMGI